MITLSTVVRFCLTLSTKGAKVSSSDCGFWSTWYFTFGLYGETAITFTLYILKILQVSLQDFLVAVADRAMIWTDSEIKLQTSPKLANSVENHFP